MSVWDELWKNRPFSQGIYFNQLDWETKVKAEGDKLKENAEKWEKLCRNLLHGPGWDINKVSTDGWNDVLGAWKKLEAVKNTVREYHKDEQLIHPIDLARLLGMILGEQSSTETPTPSTKEIKNG